MIGSVRDSPT